MMLKSHQRSCISVGWSHLNCAIVALSIYQSLLDIIGLARSPAGRFRYIRFTRVFVGYPDVAPIDFQRQIITNNHHQPRQPQPYPRTFHPPRITPLRCLLQPPQDKYRVSPWLPPTSPFDNPSELISNMAQEGYDMRLTETAKYRMLTKIELYGLRHPRVWCNRRTHPFRKPSQIGHLIGRQRFSTSGQYVLPP